MNVQVHRELIHAWDRFRNSSEARVAIMTGEGSESFCSGGDLTAGFGLCPTGEEDVARHDRGEAPGIIGPTRAIHDLYKPIIMSVIRVSRVAEFISISRDLPVFHRYFVGPSMVQRMLEDLSGLVSEIFVSPKNMLLSELLVDDGKRLITSSAQIAPTSSHLICFRSYCTG